MGTIPDHWEGENVIITFEEETKDSVYNMEGLIQNFNITGGASNTDEIYLFGSKTINFQKPREKFQAQFEGIFSKTDFDRIGFGDNTNDSGNLGSTEGKEIRSGGTGVVQRRWRIVLWFLPSENMVRDGNIVVPKDEGPIYRIILTDSKSVTFDTEMAADDLLKGTLTLEFSATDENAYANMFREYTTAQGTTALTVLNTTAHKGTLTWQNTTTKAWTGSYRT